jgi:hypothetical protein
MENPNVATSLNTQLYTSQGQYANAEPLYKRSLVIKEKVLGPDHPDVAVSLKVLRSSIGCRAQPMFAY